MLLPHSTSIHSNDQWSWHLLISKEESGYKVATEMNASAVNARKWPDVRLMSLVWPFDRCGFKSLPRETAHTEFRSRRSRYFVTSYFSTNPPSITAGSVRLTRRAIVTTKGSRLNSAIRTRNEVAQFRRGTRVRRYIRLLSEPPDVMISVK